MSKAKEFSALYSNNSFKINYVPLDSRQNMGRWASRTSNAVRMVDFTLDEINEIIRSGSLEVLRELSRYYYRTSSRYRNTIDMLACLPLYEYVVSPVFEQHKGSKVQIVKAFYNACTFVEQLDISNTFLRITKEWLKTGIYTGILQEANGKCVITDLPLEYCRTRFKDFNNLNVLELNLAYFDNKYPDPEVRQKILLTFPEEVQVAWARWHKTDLNQQREAWVMIPASAGGIAFCFAEDPSPMLIAAIPDLYKLKDAVNREETRDENELYKLLIQRMPMDSEGHLAFELDEVAEMHAGVAKMLEPLDTVDVLTTFGETTVENLQDSTAAAQSNNRIDKYKQNVYDSLGISALLFNPVNSSSLSYAIKKDESIMKSYLNAYNTWIKYQINNRFSRTGLTFDFEILPITFFNADEMRDQYFSSAQYGYSKMYAGVASGIKQLTQLSLIEFENDYLNMTEKMLPLQSSYTATNDKKNNSSEKNSSNSNQPKNINNEGGRPALPDGKKSEKTQANIESMG